MQGAGERYIRPLFAVAVAVACTGIFASLFVSEPTDVAVGRSVIVGETDGSNVGDGNGDESAAPIPGAGSGPDGTPGDGNGGTSGGPGAGSLPLVPGDGADAPSGTLPLPTTTAPADSDGPPTPVTTTAPVPATRVKDPILGLVDRNGYPAAHPDIVDAFVVTVPWADLQPTATGGIAADNAIDEAIAYARTHGMQLKLRVMSGIHAPNWVKRLGGAPIRVYHDRDGLEGTVGRWWSPAFGDAYADLMARLAARYDAVPELREVIISRCSTFYAETFIRQQTVERTVQSLYDGGYDLDADRRCLLEQSEAHLVWTTTRSGLSLNPFQAIVPERSRIELDTTFAAIDHCRAVLGERCVSQNNSIRTPTFTGNMATMYCGMAGRAGQRTFQTAAPQRVGDLVETLEWAVRYGATAVELPRTYDQMASRSDLARLDRALATGTFAAITPDDC